MVGCGFPQEQQGMNLARRGALLAGLPKAVPGTTVNRFCASSLQTARMAFHAIKAGEGDVFVAAGVESISQVDGYPKDAEELHPRLVGEGAIANVYIPMGLTAENVAERFDVSREDMDRFAQRSQERAVGAGVRLLRARDRAVHEGGRHRRRGRRRPAPLLDAREARPAGSRLQAGREGDGGQLVPAERRRGRARDHVRGEGAGARGEAAGAHHRHGGDGPRPRDHGRRPIDAVRTVLDQAGMTIDDVDVMELNEAFAAPGAPVCRELGVDPFGEKLNPHGGAIALGHPYGMTGARIMCTLLNDLDTLDGTIGLETMCVGGGQGMAMLVERLN